MRLLLLSPGTDIGGGAIALKRGFAMHAPNWHVDAVRRINNEFDYPADIVWPLRTDGAAIKELYERADVVHVWEQPQIIAELGDWRGKTIVVHHVGSRFRDDPLGVSNACAKIGAAEALGTHELMRIAPRGELVIWAAAFEVLTPLREGYQPSDRVRIAHAPTDRAIKSTDAFLAATERLARRYPIDVDLIEHVPWAECVRRKAQADIYFDQVKLGYGGNAVEAWGMGIPVVAGIADPVAREMMLADWGSLPFVEASEDTIETALEPLIADPALREHWGQTGYWFGERVFSERATVARMIDFYERVGAAVSV